MFLYGAGTSLPPVTDAILSTPGTGTNPATWSVPGDGSVAELDSTVSYVANLDPGQTPYDYVGLGLNVTTSGTALIIVTETYCVGATSTVNCNTGTSGSIQTVIVNGSVLTPPTAATFFPTSQTVAITDEIIILNNSAGGVATSVVSLDNQFDEFETPEPSTFVLFGSALSLLGIFRTRRQARKK